MILKADYETRTLKQTMHVNNEPVLEYEISYPVFHSAVFFKSTQRMNHYYRARAVSFERYCRTALYRMACEAAAAAREQGYPVMKFEAVQDFHVTYNENCALSLYFDRYMFTGGAHGMTERSSDTWELVGRGEKMGLSAVFPSHFDYLDFIMKNMIGQIAERSAGGTYFDDYEQNVAETLRAENFYLTGDGLVIYFQQYDIAPYSAGIPVFVLPYEKNGPMPPRC